MERHNGPIAEEQECQCSKHWLSIGHSNWQIMSSMEQLTCLDVPFDDAALHEVDGLKITTILHEDCGLCWCDMTSFLPDCPAQA